MRNRPLRRRHYATPVTMRMLTTRITTWITSASTNSSFTARARTWSCRHCDSTEFKRDKNMRLMIKNIEAGLFQVRRIYDDESFKSEGTYHSRGAAEARLAELKTGLEVAREQLDWSAWGRAAQALRKTRSGGRNGGRPPLHPEEG